MVRARILSFCSAATRRVTIAGRVDALKRAKSDHEDKIGDGEEAQEGGVA